LLGCIATYCEESEGTSWSTEGVKQAFRDIYGMDLAWHVRAWSYGHEKGKPKDYFAQNMETIARLTAKDPAICKTLHQRFGITNFARLPAEVWEDMYLQRDVKDMPFGEFLYPEDDPNSAFYAVKDRVAKLYNDLKKLGCLLRVYECRETDDAIDALNDAEDTYGRQLEFAIGSAHGTTNSMRWARFPNGKSCEVLTYEALERALAAGADRRLIKLARQFALGAELLLFSCSTGEGLQCIGEGLARALGIVVIAPDRRTAMDERGFDASKKPDGGFKVGINFSSSTVARTFDGRAAAATGNTP